MLRLIMTDLSLRLTCLMIFWIRLDIKRGSDNKLCLLLLPTAAGLSGLVSLVFVRLVTVVRVVTVSMLVMLLVLLLHLVTALLLLASRMGGGVRQLGGGWLLDALIPGSQVSMTGNAVMTVRGHPPPPQG